LNKLAAADDRLEMINKYFSEEQKNLFSWQSQTKVI
jgi:hypothetical protein